ncbi:class A sortase [Carnobacterium sp.]|uniref:class A sortase n=1 Tax=Carnobacterium sp. TaxID=48221 RepID=UPI00388E8664
MKKNKLRTLTWLVVLLVGLGLIFNAPIKNWMISMRSDALAIESMDTSDIDKNQQKKASFDFEEVRLLDLKTVALARFNSDQINVIGGISIPSVNLNLPIGKGTSEYTLALTAGTMKENQVMGKGNYTLAGHHMNRSDLLFSPLYEVEMGAVVYLTDLNTIYEYEITEQRTIEATEIEVLADSPDETVLTLITCDDDGITRLLTVAKFVKGIPVEEATSEMLKAFDLKVNNR